MFKFTVHRSPVVWWSGVGGTLGNCRPLRPQSLGWLFGCKCKSVAVSACPWLSVAFWPPPLHQMYIRSHKDPACWQPGSWDYQSPGKQVS